MTAPRTWLTRLRFSLMIAGLCAAAAGTGVFVARVSTVSVLGWPGDVGAVLAAADIAEGDSMLGVHESEVADAVRARFAVSQVRVVRRWPSTVEIRVVPSTTIAALQGTDVRVELFDDGHLMRAGDQAQAVEVTVDEPLAGIDVAPGSIRALAAFVVTVAAQNGSSVASASIERRQLTVHLQSDVEVRVGTEESLDLKAQSLEVLLSGKVRLDGMCRIDLRVPHAPKVLRNPHCAEKPVSDTPANAPVQADPARRVTDEEENLAAKVNATTSTTAPAATRSSPSKSSTSTSTKTATSKSAGTTTKATSTTTTSVAPKKTATR